MEMLPDEHLGILLDVIVDHRHLFCNNKVAHKEV
jgi:hypothetical protein